MSWILVAAPIFLMQPAATQAAPNTITPMAPSTTVDPSLPEQPKGHVLRLNDAVDLALKNQPTLRQAHYQTEAADARSDQALSAALPQVTAIASYQRVRSASIGGRSAATTTTGAAGAGTAPSAVVATNASGIDVFTFGASASQVIWDFGQIYNRTRAAKRLAASFEATEQVDAKNVIVDVRHNFFTARAEKALVEVAQVSLDNLQKHLVQIEGFVKVGTRPEIDLAQAKTDVANGQLALIDAQNTYLVAKAQLGRSIGIINTLDMDIADDELPAVDGEEFTVDRLTVTAIDKRPETLAAARQIDSFEMTARSARGAYAPTLSAAAGASETGTALGSLGPAWNVGLTLAWPLFQGGLTKGLVREAEANADAARASLDTAKLQIRLDIESAQIGIRSAKASRTAADEVVVNARERLRLAEGRYASGVGSVIELGDAQLALTNAFAQVVQAQYRLASARADLLAALGQR